MITIIQLVMVVLLHVCLKGVVMATWITMVLMISLVRVMMKNVMIVIISPVMHVMACVDLKSPVEMGLLIEMVMIILQETLMMKCVTRVVIVMDDSLLRVSLLRNA